MYTNPHAKSPASFSYLMASSVKVDGDGPTEGILKSRRGSSDPEFPFPVLLFGIKLMWGNFGDTSKDDGSIWISEG